MVMDFGMLAQTHGRADLIFDTAHNFFVQSLFELGSLHTLALVGFFVWLLFLGLRAALCQPWSARFIWLLSTSMAYLLILLVQEVDFIRSAYYQHAFFWGWCFATCSPKKSEVTSAQTLNFSLSQKIDKVLPFERFGQGLFWFSAGIALLTLYLATRFSLIGYQYEANSRNDFQPKVRWLKSFGTMNTVLTALWKPKKVVRYKIFASRASSYSVWSFGGWKDYPIEPKNLRYIELPAQGLFSLPYILRFNASQNDFGRNTAVLVSWPPEILDIHSNQPTQ